MSLLIACGETRVERRGPPQQGVVGRTYEAPLHEIRLALLEAFTRDRARLPAPFDLMTARELRPPEYEADWMITLIDPGGYFARYKKLPPDARVHDVLIEESVGDRYWSSEYMAGSALAQFRCAFVVHFAEAPSATTVEVYEIVPSVWSGYRWGLTRHGVGFGRYRDIQFVEPTVTDRLQLLDLIDRLPRGPQ